MPISPRWVPKTPPTLLAAHFQHAPIDAVAVAARACRFSLPAVFDDVQFAVADADIDGPSQTIQKALTVGDQLGVFLFQANVQHVETDPIVIDQIPEAAQEKAVLIFLGQSALAIEDHAAGSAVRRQA